MGVADQNLATINKFLAILVVMIGLYIALLPFWPHVSLWWDNLSDDTQGVVYRGDLSAGTDVADDKLVDPPEGNTVVIPSIKINDPVVEGSDPGNIHRGIWHRPNTPTPAEGGNSVFVGHRFSYSDPAIFFHLDKMRVGEKFAVWWDGTEYVYEVFETLVVPATAIEIEGNTEENIATLYTCTPVWTAHDRLVIKGRLINQQADGNIQVEPAES